MKNSQISIILLLFKTPGNTIKNLINYKNFNLYILDQSNNKNLKKKIKKILPNIKYYGLSSENKGFAKGINFLIKKVKTKYFLCTQPDIFISKKSILNLKKTLKAKKDAIITVPKISSFKNFKKKNRKQKVFTVNNILGAIFLADKKKFIKINMFDERFFFYWEDVDLCKRIQKTNLKIYLNSNTIALHKGESSVLPNLRTFAIRKINFKYGEYLFQAKYKKLRLIKIFRETIKFSSFALFCFFIFKFRKSFKNICFLYAIFKYLFIGRIKSFV